MMNSCARAGPAMAKSNNTTAPCQKPLRRPRDDAFRSFMAFPSPPRSQGHPHRAGSQEPTDSTIVRSTYVEVPGRQGDWRACTPAGGEIDRGDTRPRAPPGAALAGDARAAPERSASLAQAGGLPDRGDGGDALPARGG